MNVIRSTEIGTLFLVSFGCCLALRAEGIEIQRRLPPAGIELPAEQIQRLQSRLSDLRAQVDKVADLRDRTADIDVYLKAVDYALRHGEFYGEGDAAVADRALDTAAERLEQLRRGKMPWTRQRGLVVRGYYSTIDGSPQPYGLVIPSEHDFDATSPLYVWLHGRGDKVTDLHFIQRRESNAGRIAPTDAIVVHPFGRHCVGYKHAGEIDVLEVIQEVRRQYRIDPARIVLMGFSMGGAGVWHIGAHYGSRFVAISPGAGFAETAQYNRLMPQQYPAWYEQRLWTLYDVPNYTRNLFNLPVVAYSGELDKQIQAARVMEEAFAAHGKKLTHVIGPGMGHSYHPDSLPEIMRRMNDALPRDPDREMRSRRLTLQTRTLRYNQVKWLRVLQLHQHWTDTRVDAEVNGNRLQLATRNVKALRLERPPLPNDQFPWEIFADGQRLRAEPTEDGYVDLIQREGSWKRLDNWKDRNSLLPGDPLLKRPGLQGPIDDAFLSPFLVVIPTGRSKHSAVRRWVEFEQQHFLDRWRALMRGEARVKRDVDVTQDDIQTYNLILWGDPASNELIRRVLDQLPIQWTDTGLQVASETFPVDQHLPVMIYPNPLNPRNYIVLNSGLTFREGHDRTNSLQNPKLPDWAVLDLSQDPDALTPGRIVAAGFFDEAWRWRER